MADDARSSDRQSLLKTYGFSFGEKNVSDIVLRLDKIRTTHKNSISNEDLKAELLMMMVAAPDTTSALICSVINQVVKHPAIHERLTSEIMTMTAAGKLNQPVASFAQIRDLPFFTACIQECARLFPSVPVVITRRVPEEGLILKDMFVAGGTAIGASATVINRDPTVFGADAAEFRPQRWLDGSDRVALMNRLIFSWGYGPRECLGKNLALLETYKFCFQVSNLMIE